MALEVQAAHQRVRDFSCDWRLRTLLNAAPAMAKAQTPFRDSSKQLLSSSDNHRSDTFSEILPGEPKASARRSPPVQTVRRAKSSHFLPIASLLNPHTGLKRRRHRLDVDGPNTAALSSKKRRLRLDLVTSPLSRPYAQPASHIHVRTDGKAAACRSAKKGATVAAQPRLPHLPVTSFLRLSVVNRMRQCLELRPPPVLRLAGPDTGLNAAPKASWFQSRPRDQPAARTFNPAPLAVGAGRRVAAKRPSSTRDIPPDASDKTLPELQGQPCPPSTGLKLAAIDTITSFLSSAPPPAPEDDQLFMSVHHDFGQDDFVLRDRHDATLPDVSDKSQDVFYDFGVLFGKAQPRCAGGQEQSAREAEGPREVPW